MMRYFGWIFAVLICMALYISPAQALLGFGQQKFDTSSTEAFIRSWNNIYSKATPVQQEGLRHALARAMEPIEKFDATTAFQALPDSAATLTATYDENIKNFSVDKIEDYAALALDAYGNQARFTGKTADEAIQLWAKDEKAYVDAAIPAFKSRLDEYHQKLGVMQALRDAAAKNLEVADQNLANKNDDEQTQALFAPYTLSNVSLTQGSEFRLFLKFTLANNGTEPIDGVTLKLQIFEDDQSVPFVDDLTTPDLKGDIPPGQQREIVQDVGPLYWLVAGKVKAESYAKFLTPVIKLHEVQLLNGRLIRADMNTAPILARANAALDKNHLEFQAGAVEINIRSEYPGVLSGYERMVKHAQFINQYLSPADQLKSLPGANEMAKLLEIARALKGG